MKICQYLLLYIKNNMPKVLHYNTFYFLRYAHPRCVKCLFTNIHKQWNTLKSLIFKKNTKFTGKQLESSQDLECEFFRVSVSHERDHIGRFSNLYQCTFNSYFNKSLLKQQTFLYYVKKLLLLFFQRALNITIPTNTLVLLIKTIKN